MKPGPCPDRKTQTLCRPGAPAEYPGKCGTGDVRPALAPGSMRPHRGRPRGKASFPLSQDAVSQGISRDVKVLLLKVGRAPRFHASLGPFC